MRPLFGYAALGFGLALSLWSRPAQAQEEVVQQNFDTFNQGLSPYGEWDADATYGQVFYPRVQVGWRPYLYGRWVMTDRGWTWVSEEPFGWATFHYGRWWWNPYRNGWAWVPGYEWAPAWVAWRYGGESIGWGPLYVGYDRWVEGYPIYYNHWTYVPCEHFYGGPVYSYAYPVSYVQNNFYRTYVSAGYVGQAAYGPPVTYVQRHSAVPITTAPIIHSASPEGVSGRSYSGGAVTMYRPPNTPAYSATNRASAEFRGAGAEGVGGIRGIVHPPVYRPMSAVNGARPAAGMANARPTNEMRPQANENRPQANQYHPTENQYRPQVNENRPQENQYRPQVNENRPQENQYRPQVNENRPQENQYRPQANENRPQENQYRPQANENRPQANQYRPPENQYRPQTNQYRPAMYSRPMPNQRPQASSSSSYRQYSPVTSHFNQAMARPNPAAPQRHYTPQPAARGGWYR